MSNAAVLQKRQKPALELVLDRLRLDPDTGRFYWRKPPKGHPRLQGAEAGSPRVNRREKSYWVIKINGTPWNRSRLVFLVLNGRWPEPCIDHINGDSLDDRPCNLREVTVTQNAWNHKGRRKLSPLPMGVRATKTGFAARISHNKNHLSLGVFGTQEEASAAYVAKRKELFGEFSGY